MHDIFLSVLIFTLYSIGITLLMGILTFLALVIFSYMKYMRYYYAIYKHPEIFGDPKEISWEVKKTLIKEMAKKTENKLKKLNPNIKNENNLKIYVSDDTESA